MHSHTDYFLKSPNVKKCDRIISAIYALNIEDFSLYILDTVESNDGRRSEYEWIKKYKTYIRGHGYNYKDTSFLRWLNVSEIPLKEGLPEEFCTGGI